MYIHIRVRATVQHGREAKYGVVYDFTISMSDAHTCQRVLRRHALTANHEWQVIAMVDTHNAEA